MKYKIRLIKEDHEELGISIVESNTKDGMIQELLDYLYMSSGYYEVDDACEE